MITGMTVSTMYILRISLDTTIVNLLVLQADHYLVLSVIVAMVYIQTL